MPPVNVLVLDLQHFAAPAAGVERPDDPVAHLVTRGQLDLGIPDVATDNLTTQRPGDVECRRKLALLNASLGTRPYRPDIIPGQLRGPTRRLVQLLAGIEQPLLFCFRDAPFAPPLILARDSDASTMESRRCEEIAADRPVTDVPQPSEVAVRGCDRAIRISRFELLDRVRTFERCRRQPTKVRSQNTELTHHPVAALERLDVDVSRPVQAQQIRNGCGPVSRSLAIGRNPRIFT